MPHDHHGHVHLDPASGDRRVSLAIWANALLTAGQLIGGILSGSLALIADAVHNFADMASLVVALVARKIARRPADDAMPFGYGRVEIVAALVNYTSLILISLWLAWEGVLRWIEPQPVAGWAVVILGGLALVVDAATAALTWSMREHSANIRAAYLHNLADALSSVAVIAGGVLILVFDLNWIDPVITIGIAVYILWLAVQEIGSPIRILMLGSPPGIDPASVVSAMCGVGGVNGVHHLRLWLVQEHETALQCHVVLDEDGWGRIERVKDDLRAMLESRFHIHHASLEVEHWRDANCAGAAAAE